MVWRSNQSEFDPSRCPECGATMRLARIEPRPIRRFAEFERHIYRCEDCDNVSRFVVDRQAADGAIEDAAA
ncbi:hypothetical protein [Rhodopseudomonas sp. B29]|uniref:hypothetical protein n=1 Tax=Rhodopseudomonas sp. B29 TaxID=95607 RepID=UPI0003489901|nr:hypothetical protein [Rhodopseudomonas sp. B29]